MNVSQPDVVTALVAEVSAKPSSPTGLRNPWLAFGLAILCSSPAAFSLVAAAQAVHCNAFAGLVMQLLKASAKDARPDEIAWGGVEEEVSRWSAYDRIVVPAVALPPCEPGHLYVIQVGPSRACHVPRPFLQLLTPPSARCRCRFLPLAPKLTGPRARRLPACRRRETLRFQC